MKEIRLNKLMLRDFQGGSFILDTKGKDVFIFAANAMGKTRLVSAFTWLLFGKDALGRSDFEIKNLDAQGEATHGLEHTVEAELSIDGKIETLKKVFQEKWQKKRGSANKEFTGHTTNYFINGVPIQEKDYIARIAEISGDELIFKLLTSPMGFPSLPPLPTLKETRCCQRSILLEVCGDILDEDVIRSNPKLTPMLEWLGGKNFDDRRKIILARRSEINKEIEKIPVRIDEVRRGMPITEGIDRKAAEKEAQELETALNDAKLRLQGINTGGNISTLSMKLSGLNADLRKMEDVHRSGSLSTLNRLNQQISELQSKIDGFQRRRFDISEDITRKEKTIQRLDLDLAELRKRWTAIDGETFQTTIADICPTCGQALPSERVQAAREKALALFNQNKAEKLGDIDRRGHALKDDRDKLEKEVKTLRFEMPEVEAKISAATIELKQAIEDRDLLKRRSEEFYGIQGRADLLDEIEDVEAQIKSEREGKAEEATEIREKIDELQKALFHAKSKIDLFRQREQGEKRIEELKAEEKTLASEFERLENQLYLMDEFIKTKVSMLTDRINSKFEMVRFKLFNQLINGGIEDCCEITVNGVPFNAGLNNAARIQAGCDIVRTLQQHFGMKAPIFVDNREAVTDLPEMGCQMISLVVSPEDKELRIEIAEAAKAGNTELRSRSSARRLTLS